VYENRIMKLVKIVSKTGGERMRKRNRGGELYQSTLYASVEISQ
jgi:hypothetical protein